MSRPGGQRQDHHPPFPGAAAAAARGPRSPLRPRSRAPWWTGPAEGRPERPRRTLSGPRARRSDSPSTPPLLPSPVPPRERGAAAAGPLKPSPSRPGAAPAAAPTILSACAREEKERSARESGGRHGAGGAGVSRGFAEEP